MRKGLTEQDRAIWAQYAAQVQALPGRPGVDVAPVVVAAAVMPATAVAKAVKAVPRAASVVVGQVPAGVDRATWQRFRSGRLPVGRRLDLHGHTAQVAFDRFEQVLLAAAASGVRCIEVITGRGSGEGGGVLRRELPLWINLPHLRPFILAARHPHAANDGAVVLLLRRGRDQGGGRPA